MQDTNSLERFAVMLGAVACVVITTAVWRSVSSYQDMWPLPALYLIEMAALGTLAAYAFMRGGPVGKVVAWAGVGILTAFCVLGAWSIGFLYLPVTLIFGVVLVTNDVRNGQRILAHLGVSVIAGLGQAALMLTAIRLLYPSAVF